jgi:hypothetical protein
MVETGYRPANGTCPPDGDKRSEQVNETRYITVSAATVERHERAEAQARARRARYESRARRGASHGKQAGTHHESSRFVFWDGEGPRDAGYALFGNSDGWELCQPWLPTVQCLDYILDHKMENPGTINTSFGFNYDVSMILRELSWRHFSALHKYAETVWREYELQHVPHKWFRVKRGGVTATIYDIRSFFAGDFLSSLRQFGIGDEATLNRIEEGKKNRDRFVWADIPGIRRYWQSELGTGVELSGKLRTMFADAGYTPRSWHGPGALARAALGRHKVYDAMAVCPLEVRVAAQHAFAGGRFELFLAGHANREVYSADINSAYPYYAMLLPNLSRGKWRRTRRFESGKFGVYHIVYNAKPDAYRAYPLFRRMASGEVAWPHRTEGWYWSPEAELVANDPDAKFREGWVFDEDDVNDRPFAWLAEYYYRRKRLKDAGNPAEYTFKLIINSVYGQLAQRTGWDRKHRRAPRSHQIEYAGFITSACRAAVYRVALESGRNLVSIDTDGVSSLAAFHGLNAGNQFGEWEITRYRDGIFWQSGIYSLKTDDGWVKARTRGIPKGSYTHEELLTCLAANEPLRLSKNVFVSYGLALGGRRDELNTWVKEPHEFAMGGAGKRIHFPGACRTMCDGMHRLGMVTPLYGPDGDPMSLAHNLPWLEEPDDLKITMDDLMMFDADHLDFEEEWVREYANV